MPLHPRRDRLRTRDLAEAGLKYLIVGGFGSAVLLFGSAFVYGATSELSFPAIAAADPENDAFLFAGLAMILAGLAFKVSAAPFHMWTPDVYQGSPTSVTAFMAAATKTAALVVTLRVLVTAFPEQGDVWTIAVAVLAAISLVWGNLGALAQRDVKRILAYSSISHAGFMLMAIAANSERGGEALLYYLVPYSRDVGRRVRGDRRARARAASAGDARLARRHGLERPYHGIALWIFMLGMAGFPLTGGMFGKLFVFSAAYEAGDWWLVLVGVAFTAVSLGYYLNIVRGLYMRQGGAPPRSGRRLAPSRPSAQRRRRGGRRGHRRLVLRRPADPRRRIGRSGLAPLLRLAVVLPIGEDPATANAVAKGGNESTPDRHHHRHGRIRPGGGSHRARRQARAARHVEVPRPQGRGAGSPEPREPATERVPALLERDREHGRWAVGDASGERARIHAHHDRDSGDPLERLTAPLRDPAEAGRPLLHDPVRTGRVHLRVPPDAQPLAHRRRGTVRGARGSPTGTVVGGNSIKVGFCLLDLYNLTGNAPTSEKTFWDCYTSYQGVSAGWVDQYHQATDGQQVVLTGLPNATDYYLVSTTNPTGAFLETNKTNNAAWVKFTLSSTSNGNRKVTVTATRHARARHVRRLSAESLTAGAARPGR